jgi:hypothetical protein
MIDASCQHKISRWIDSFASLLYDVNQLMSVQFTMNVKSQSCRIIVEQHAEPAELNTQSTELSRADSNMSSH